MDPQDPVPPMASIYATAKGYRVVVASGDSTPSAAREFGSYGAAMAFAYALAATYSSMYHS